MDTTEQLNLLLGSLYESIATPGGEEAFLEQYAECLEASSGAVIVATDLKSGSARVLAATRVDPAYLKAYEEYYGSVNVYVQRAKHLTSHGVALPGQALCPDNELERTEYYADYMRPQRIYHSLALNTHLEGALYVHLGAVRPKNAAAFGSQEIGIAEMLAPHFGSAMRLRQSFLHEQQRAMAVSQLADALPFGVFQVNAAGQVLEANRAGAGILRANDGLRMSRGELSAALSSESAELRRLIAAAARTGNRDGLQPGGTMRISRLLAPHAYSVFITPFRIPGQMPGDGCPTALVIVADPAGEPASDQSHLCGLFGLTPAEARLCALLLEGKPLRTIAEELHITWSTARTHLKRILSKTGAGRQSDLVRILLSSLPVRRAIPA